MYMYIVILISMHFLALVGDHVCLCLVGMNGFGSGYIKCSILFF